MPGAPAPRRYGSGHSELVSKNTRRHLAPTNRHLGFQHIRYSHLIAIADGHNWSKKTWRDLLDSATPRERSPQLDPVQSYISGVLTYRPRPELRDEPAEEVLAYLLHQVRVLLESLQRTPQDGRTPSCATLIDSLSELMGVVADLVFRKGLPRPQQNLPRWELHESAGFLEAFDRLREDILALGDLSRGDRIFDMIQADLWSSRPQLFEVWLLTSLLQWLADRGYDLQLLKLSRQPSGRCEWRLSYAKDAEPCARLSGRPDAGWVYFQRYRPGEMPDICFVPESGSIAQPLWVVDAKHSDAGATRHLIVIAPCR